MSALARRAPTWTLTAVLALAYVIAAPPSSDLAAAAYRSDLLSRVGFSLWDNSWYGGHHLLAYSVLAPALGALIGPQLLAALSMTVLAALFALLIEGRFPSPATRLAGLWLALGAAISLLANRVPFDLGLAIGAGSLLLAQRGHLRWALVLGVVCSLASPVAGLFLALAYLAWALAGPARAWPLALSIGTLLPIGALALAFPEGGTQPFDPSAFYPALAGVLAIAALIPREQAALRIGAVLYAVALTGSYFLSTAVGANSDRLGALFAGPVAVLVLAGGTLATRRTRVLLVLAPFLLYWQANAPVADFAAASADPAVRASYYSPLLGQLRALGVGYGRTPARIEVVPLNDHWEARWMAPHVMMARGWERQLDRYRNGIFYDASRPLTAADYRAWLLAQAVSYVALPDAALDYSAVSEGRLLRHAPGYLREVWRSAHWRLFAVLGARPLADPPAVLSAVSSDSVTLRAPSAGSFLVRVHYTPYWAIAGSHACVARAGEDWTTVRTRAAGSVRLVIRFALTRIFDGGARCG